MGRQTLVNANCYVGRLALSNTWLIRRSSSRCNPQIDRHCTNYLFVTALAAMETGQKLHNGGRAPQMKLRNNGLPCWGDIGRKYANVTLNVGRVTVAMATDWLNRQQAIYKIALKMIWHWGKEVALLCLVAGCNKTGQCIIDVYYLLFMHL